MDGPTTMKAEHFRRLVNLWPPYFASGIRCNTIASDFTHAAVMLREQPWNMNWVGTHYGGNLFSMCDPWFMFLLRQQLGPEYIVWDKFGTIDFQKPGRGTLVAAFHVPREQVQQIRRETVGGKKTFPQFQTRILDGHGHVVAEVTKTCYVRPKKDMGRFHGESVPLL